MRRAWVPSGFIASLAPKPCAVGGECQRLWIRYRSVWSCSSRPAVADVEHFQKIEIAPCRSLTAIILQMRAFRPVGRWLVHTIDRQEREGVLKPSIVDSKTEHAWDWCIGNPEIGLL